VLKKRAETKDFELLMRIKASTVGNIVGKDVPISLTEVRILAIDDPILSYIFKF
jgi:hypothetical protein